VKEKQLTSTGVSLDNCSKHLKKEHCGLQTLGGKLSRQRGGRRGGWWWDNQGRTILEKAKLVKRWEGLYKSQVLPRERGEGRKCSTCPNKGSELWGENKVGEKKKKKKINWGVSYQRGTGGELSGGLRNGQKNSAPWLKMQLVVQAPCAKRKKQQKKETISAGGGWTCDRKGGGVLFYECHRGKRKKKIIEKISGNKKGRRVQDDSKEKKWKQYHNGKRGGLK